MYQMSTLLMIQHKSDFNETSNLATKQNMKKDINHFLHNIEKWSNILKNSAVFTSQVFKSMFGHFSTLQRKGLN